MAFNRYEFSKQEQKRYKTTVLPTIEKTFEDRYIFSREGDLKLVSNIKNKHSNLIFKSD